MSNARREAQIDRGGREVALLKVNAIAEVALIRFGGHIPKGGYDVDHGGHEGATNATKLH